jgi:hypothetical protein
VKPAQPVIIGYRFAAVPEWIIYEEALTPLAVRIFACLARHGTDPSNCYPSNARIARLVHCDRSTVKGILRALEEVGAIRRFPRWDEHGRQTSNGFLLAGDRRLLPAAASDTGGGRDNSPRGGRDNSPGGGRTSPPKENHNERDPNEGVALPDFADSDRDARQDDLDDSNDWHMAEGY